jgi:hypothetical protein
MSALAFPPVLDTRSYQELVDEALARIPIHNPDWTNFNESDPGVTLVELFAFLTESLLYRANQIPERNRRAFLSLLGVPLKPATAAAGAISLSNDTGPLQTTTLGSDLEVLAGQVPFRTELGLDLLPAVGRAYYKRPIPNPPQQTIDHYAALYASYTEPAPDLTKLSLYDTVELTPDESGGVDLAATADGSLWIALLLRPVDGTGQVALARARAALAGRTLSLGIVPMFGDPEVKLSPLGRSASEAQAVLSYRLPSVAADGSLGSGAGRGPSYRVLDAVATTNVLDEPGVVQLTLPNESGLAYWLDVGALEAGAGDMPPPFEDTNLAARLITWLRITAPSGGRAKLIWAGINAAQVTQQARAADETLPAGTGAPDQVVGLAHQPVIADSVRVTVDGTAWTRVDDLYAAGAEVPVPDLRLPPGAPPAPAAIATAYTVDAATGIIRFGDGLHGARPALNATLRASYAYASGGAGNVGAGSISSSPALPAGISVTNPVRTWGGADAEAVDDGEKQIARWLQHRDRLVSADDFEAIVRRTPGIEVGRIDVIPAFNPELSPNSPGDAPGAVTLMLIPAVDPAHPGAPQPDQPFLDAVCSYIDPRRLVTTEVFLRGPSYKPIWLSVGLQVVAGTSVAVVCEAVKAALLAFLAPLPAAPGQPPFQHSETGWPRLKSVLPLELVAVASRVDGVDLVAGVLVTADATGDGSAPVTMSGLELPFVSGISVLQGDPLALSQLMGSAPPSPSVPTTVVPVPVIPDSC